jgi:hypothetical protein
MVAPIACSIISDGIAVSIALNTSDDSMIGLINENSFSCNGLTLVDSRLTPNLADFGLTEKYWDAHQS